MCRWPGFIFFPPSLFLQNLIYHVNCVLVDDGNCGRIYVSSLAHSIYVTRSLFSTQFRRPDSEFLIVLLAAETVFFRTLRNGVLESRRHQTETAQSETPQTATFLCRLGSGRKNAGMCTVVQCENRWQMHAPMCVIVNLQCTLN